MYPSRPSFSNPAPRIYMRNRSGIVVETIVMTMQFVFSLGERLVLPNTSRELEYFRRHNDKTLRGRELAVARAAKSKWADDKLDSELNDRFKWSVRTKSNCETALCV